LNTTRQYIQDNFTKDCETLNTKNKNKGVQSIDYPECRGKSFEWFWNWLPNEQVKEYFDYERDLYQTTIDHKYIWIKKATGLGITEFMIRWIAWKCLSSDEWKDTQVDTNVVLITGPRIELSITIINRLKNLFNEEFKSKETVCILNGSRIEAFPSHHLATARGLNPRIVFLDEADFFPVNQQKDARDVSERYIAKTNPHIIMVSTPNLPGGLYEEMEKEKDCMYERLKLGYQLGENKIYTPEGIAEAKLSPSFEREYNLQYGYGVGDIFVDFDSIIEKYNLNYLGGSSGTYADPAFGSSKFGKVCGEIRDGIIYVTEAEEYQRASPSNMLDTIQQSWERHQGHCKVDAAHPGFIKDLNERNIPALAVAFGSLVPEHEGLTKTKEASKQETLITLKKKLPINASMMVKRKQVRIHPDFTDLISQMRAVKFDKKGGINKDQVPFDLVDAFDMMCWDLKQFDYSSIGITLDGKIMKDKPKKKEGGLSIKTKVIE